MYVVTIIFEYFFLTGETGLVGTAMYVSPELLKQDVRYSQVKDKKKSILNILVIFAMQSQS